ncbi:hypothetical protein WG70_01940 [Burkholderia oklahomensis EO147]|nr:hypothetical protein WG70_01940 [Burkholderia oklahomensis EO147]KUY48374.1 hypothetical protein WG70_01720 [Burkholderia oklahomensis EO147]
MRACCGAARRGTVRYGTAHVTARHTARHGERDVDASVRAPSRDARRISRPVPGDWRNAACAVRETRVGDRRGRLPGVFAAPSVRAVRHA